MLPLYNTFMHSYSSGSRFFAFHSSQSGSCEHVRSLQGESRGGQLPYGVQGVSRRVRAPRRVRSLHLLPLPHFAIYSPPTIPHLTCALWIPVGTWNYTTSTRQWWISCTVRGARIDTACTYSTRQYCRQVEGRKCYVESPGT